MITSDGLSLPRFAIAEHTVSVPNITLPARIANPSMPLRRVFTFLSNRQFLFHLLVELLRDRAFKRGLYPSGFSCLFKAGCAFTNICASARHLARQIEDNLARGSAKNSDESIFREMLAASRTSSGRYFTNRRRSHSLTPLCRSCSR